MTNEFGRERLGNVGGLNISDAVHLSAFVVCMEYGFPLFMVLMSFPSLLSSCMMPAFTCLNTFSYLVAGAAEF
jgi:hypothetical protein